jgi:hypothetical protein
VPLFWNRVPRALIGVALVLFVGLKPMKLGAA